MTRRGLASAAPGDRVRLTGYFLAATGQRVGSEGSKVWTVLACECGLCGGGRHCAVNEPHLCQEDPTGYEDIPTEQRPKWRHVALANLQRIGAPPRAADQPEEVGPPALSSYPNGRKPRTSRKTARMRQSVVREDV